MGGIAPPPQAHSAAALQRQGNSAAAADKGWWTFTLTGKYLDRVHGYTRRTDSNEKGKLRDYERDGAPGGGAGDDDGQSLRSIRSRLSRLSRRSSRTEPNRDVEKQEYHRKMRQNMSLKLAPPNVFSVNQTTVRPPSSSRALSAAALADIKLAPRTQTPGWSTPWTPFRREGQAQNYQDPFDLSQNAAAAQQSKRSRFEDFILQNPFSPLFIRTINLVLICCTLGLAAHIRVQEVQAGVLGVIGTSTLFAIVVAPFAIVHIFVTLYVRPSLSLCYEPSSALTRRSPPPPPRPTRSRRSSTLACRSACGRSRPR